MQLINYQPFYKWIVSEYNAGRMKVKLEFNGIVYDSKFVYNEQKDIFTADSTTSPGESFICYGQNMAILIADHHINITILR